MSKRKYTKEQFEEIVKTSSSIRQALKKLKLAPQGGNYKTFHKYIKKLNIDVSHFTGQLWNKGKTLGHKYPIEYYFDNKTSISSFALKKRLLLENIFPRICQSCGLKEWLGKNIPLELDHINGDNSNNNLKNLRLLCPNCHAFTPTYRGKNKKK